mmetsp:Transcript_13326/g.32429  ORF Transcript_13326/g.32429 Transcript_13326/m.32429 type:complete len:216 (+) Transcript_13326:409-1056(+)
MAGLPCPSLLYLTAAPSTCASAGYRSRPFFWEGPLGAFGWLLSGHPLANRMLSHATVCWECPWQESTVEAPAHRIQESKGERPPPSADAAMTAGGNLRVVYPRALGPSSSPRGCPRQHAASSPGLALSPRSAGGVWCDTTSSPSAVGLPTGGDTSIRPSPHGADTYQPSPRRGSPAARIRSVRSPSSEPMGTAAGGPGCCFSCTWCRHLATEDSV